MKMRNKGKVYPSPSSTSSSSSFTPSNTANRGAHSVLKLLPAAILALVAILSLDDREVFAYMITRSIKSSANSSATDDDKKKHSKKSSTHKPPVFDCECFDCYTSYWFRWDSSPNRELIHQAIEAYEEQLARQEQSKKNGRGKKKEKLGRRVNIAEVPAPEGEMDLPEVEDGFLGLLPDKDAGAEGNGEEEEEEEVKARIDFPEEEPPQTTTVVLRSLSANDHKGLARKVLPDVVGLLNSRLWSLWSPNV